MPLPSSPRSRMWSTSTFGSGASSSLAPSTPSRRATVRSTDAVVLPSISAPTCPAIWAAAARQSAITPGSRSSLDVVMRAPFHPRARMGTQGKPGKDAGSVACYARERPRTPIRRSHACSCEVPHDREGDNLAQRVAFGEDHDKTIDAHAAAGGGRVAVLDRARVLLVVGVGDVGVVDHAPLALLDEALPLVDGVVELGVAADELDAADDRVEVLRQLGVHGV